VLQKAYANAGRQLRLMWSSAMIVLAVAAVAVYDATVSAVASGFYTASQSAAMSLVSLRIFYK